MKRPSEDTTPGAPVEKHIRMSEAAVEPRPGPESELSYAEKTTALRQRKLKRLNENIVGHLRGVIERETLADLSPVLKRHAEQYPGRRAAAETAQPPRSEVDFKSVAQTVPETFSSVYVPKANAPRMSHEDKKILQVPDGEVNVLSDLAPRVRQLLSDDATSSFPNGMRAALSKALQAGHILHAKCARAVVKLNSDVIVKIGVSLDMSECSVLEFIRERSPACPAPRPLGAISIGNLNYVFTSFIPGESLQKRWPGMTPEEKGSITDQLSGIMQSLRCMPWDDLSHTTASKSLGWQGQCKDVRLTTRISDGVVSNEREFNQFLMTDRLPKITDHYVSFLLRMLREDHEIVFTHGDLHPRNIVVSVVLRFFPPPHKRMARLGNLGYGKRMRAEKRIRMLVIRVMAEYGIGDVVLEE